jgi:hypothetical protein
MQFLLGQPARRNSKANGGGQRGTKSNCGDLHGSSHWTELHPICSRIFNEFLKRKSARCVLRSERFQIQTFISVC